MQSFVAISHLSHRTAQQRCISGETKARRRTFAPQGHSRKSLKAGNLSVRLNVYILNVHHYHSHIFLVYSKRSDADVTQRSETFCIHLLFWSMCSRFHNTRKQNQLFLFPLSNSAGPVLHPYFVT
ncbi:hypothetical protein GOODEAATRI_011796 [Goodea atripinnis]|uniref:Uncharacterized protein n=1 Tax=Goodea atripinnis TaxID=208336 RepID=A0ABV0N9Z5_9TELE